jgi:pimeloyl-ACP methyl ester carboxylesterase
MGVNIVAAFISMQTGFITYNHSQIHYSWFGTGPQLLLCLHGYGESEQTFRFLEKYIGHSYTVAAIDFPFHGNTQWNEGLQFTPAGLLAIVQALRTQHHCMHEPVTVMGYSMGGRVALQLLQQMPNDVKKVILLAPDGLKVNIWYWLATQTYIGKHLFAFTMKHPGWFFLLLQTGNRLGLINQSVVKFTRFYINDATARRQLYERWICMRYIRPNLALLKKIIHTRRLPVRLLYGQFDRIIRYERGEKFRRGIESFCTLHIIKTGHQVLQEKHVDQIVPLLQS